MPRRDDPFELAQREIERLWRDLVYHRHPTTHFTEQTWSPPADLVVTRDSARVIVELAGVPRESVRVRLRGRVLDIRGLRTPPQDPPGARYHRAEIYFGEFRRVIELPWDADEKGIKASHRDGMLVIQIRAGSVPRREVPIATGSSTKVGTLSSSSVRE